MRDPLSWVPIRYKLPLAFLAVCLVAFGVGGIMVMRTAGEALEGELLQRLDERAAATAVIVERHLDLVQRRAEDFASDGFIRSRVEAHAEAQQAGDGAAAGAHREALLRHFERNKLPLVDAFVDAECVTTRGPILDRFDPETPAAERTAVASLRNPTAAHPHPTFVISTPLSSLAGSRRIGTLQLLVRTDTWLAGMHELDALPASDLRAWTLSDRNGAQLALGQTGGGLRTASPRTGEAGLITYRSPIAEDGWELEIQVDRAQALAPVVQLRNEYLLIGGLLLLITAGVLFFPLRFLLRPLGTIGEAAKRIAAGDFRARVEHDTRDEIGDLARAFNIMARAVEERTRRLEETAGTLERRQADVRFERDRLEAVIRSMEDGLFILDRDGRVTLSNAAAQPLVKAIERSDPAPKKLTCTATSTDTTACLHCLTDLARGQRSCVIDIDERIYEVHVTTLSAANGPPSRLCVSRDVTTRMAQQDGQAHQERMAVLGEIAAVMAHELNNPLAAISMFAQMLKTQIDGQVAAGESVDVIQRNVQTCKQTIRGLLDLAAKGALETAELSMHDLLEDVRRFLRPIYERANVSLVVQPDATDARLVADEVQLRQVLMNLVMNAIQAFEGRGGTVTLRTQDRGDHLWVEIRDDGPGVPVDVRSRVFEPFFTTKEAGSGTGLGLPTSRRIVQEHGGTLELVESDSTGTVFHMLLPRKADRPAWRARVRMNTEVPTPSASAQERVDA